MPLELIIEERMLSKVMGISRAYFDIKKRIEKDQKDSFSKLYRLMQTGNIRIELVAQEQLMEEIKENPLGYNFEFIANVLERPSLLSRRVPTIYRHDNRIETSQKLVGEYFGEKLASRTPILMLPSIAYNPN